ncbi:MAG: SDR family oxidoreductase [Betaproteobacteria bacterium]|jgi:NAD(P)-dependent dehydrogenase (short-subunit alcohol dehydrogenase family)|nr:SDR family oxidoreductase [Betaproteobacteria bacterium]
MTERLALVTGGGSGIGAAIARAASRAGYRVAIMDAQADAAAAMARELGNAVALPCDVTDELAVDAALATLGATPDLLVNNAGIVKFGHLVDMSVKDFRRVLEVDLVGVYILSRAVGLMMRARGQGNIVNISSINAITPSLGTNAYAAAKGGLVTMTKLLALELGPHGVRVNSVSPGFVDGGMSTAVFANPRTRDIRTKAVPLRRLGSTEDIAQAVMFLASDAAAYVHGQDLGVDGGLVHSLLSQIPRD